MGFSNTFTIVVLSVMLALIIIGIIIILIMKKIKASDKVRAITSVAVVFVALLLAGYLVYDVSMGMMYNLVNSKSYKEYTIENDDKTLSVIVKEYNSVSATGFEIYTGNELLGDVATDMYLPFINNEYKPEWEDNSVKIYYTFKRTDDEYICKYCIVNLKNKSVSDSVKSEFVFADPSEKSSYYENSK